MESFNNKTQLTLSNMNTVLCLKRLVKNEKKPLVLSDHNQPNKSFVLNIALNEKRNKQAHKNYQKPNQLHQVYTHNREKYL